MAADGADNTAAKWKELNGASNWAGLLNPLDADLRRNIIRYGELAQCTYDSFNTEPRSHFTGACRFGRADFFARCEHPRPDTYQVTKFVYATATMTLPASFFVRSVLRDAWSKESNWMGYVAVATDAGKAALGRRDIVVAWRGTIQTLEWVNDLDFTLIPAGDVFGPSFGGLGNMAHRGWLNIYTSSDPKSKYNPISARDQVIQEVKRLLEVYKDEEVSITITGHSLGAALATVNAIDIVGNGINGNVPVTAFAFASPRVGNLLFQQAANRLRNLHILRIANVLDIVPKYPMLGAYFDVGVGVTVNYNDSPSLKKPGMVTSWHNLEMYLHLIAGSKGGDGKFKLVVERDVELVNKSDDILTDDYAVPVGWKSEKDKCMARGDDGHWKLYDNEEI